ncbi:MAG: chromosome segregation in meiosis- protein [Claussenomyces sp. TS43310]|nr:MAG: chromosome segregation in meiosis- protein [Claussenomyces sp. TS43310]
MAPYMDDTTSSEQATRTQAASGPAAGGDDLDDLFDYDAGIDDPFRPITPPRAVTQKDSSTRNRAGAGAGLGIDEEVEVKKKPRVPRAKLDETRLLSYAGIPKLRNRAKDLKFKGKGHEYSDAARLLSLYQLWLDDLFPKARFLDALAMVEKEGHKKRMQLIRMQWINEGQPQDIREESPPGGEKMQEGNNDNQEQPTLRLAPIFETTSTERPKTPAANVTMQDNIYDATPRAAIASSENRNNTEIISIFGAGNKDDEPDDLDALLAEAETDAGGSGNGVTSGARQAVAREPEFEDEMEAMAGIEDMW